MILKHSILTVIGNVLFHLIKTFLHSSKMKDTTKYHIVETTPKFNRKVVET